ncbi:HAD family hydrolase [Candidatus Stoquefichus sp. SB1]|uniref:HAD family hydrolase n=1 Tax=Candidatus Stoquefichus sp. SB1 TaxID=1658109 RepID=UPI00067F17FE|nr:HAD family phosphatase [Candidatus Stoquefichus sp. SB1]
MIKAVIFDMDGLMIDSERVTYVCYVKILAKMGLSMSEDFYKTLLGKTLPTAYQLMFDEYGNDFPMDQVLNDVHMLMDDIFIKEGVPLKQGLVELLTYLKDNDYKTIVATSSTRHRMERLLTMADVYKYFDNSICGDEVTHGKPHPEVFLKACEKINIVPSEAIVLEDSEAGIEAAHTAQIPVICIPDMKYPEPAFVQMTSQIFHSLDNVIDFLKQSN